MAAFANEPLHKDALLVTILRDLGAVFYVKTNVPVAMMMAETNNNVWGECRNPLHKYLSPGGSSGGEGALIAFKASPLGIGTDIGGSIRIPAAWSNLYGLKPSFGRYPHYGAKPGIAGQEYILSVNGPMSRSLKTLKLYSEAVLSERVSPWDFDHKCIPLPWRKNVIQPVGRKLRFGLIGIDDGLVTVHPPVERALQMTKTALERQGHEVIPWSTEDHEVIVRVRIQKFTRAPPKTLTSSAEFAGSILRPWWRRHHGHCETIRRAHLPMHGGLRDCRRSRRGRARPYEDAYDEPSSQRTAKGIS